MAWGVLHAQDEPGGGGEAFPAAALYRRLGAVGLDKARVYRIREASIEREDLHLTLNDGIIAFTLAVDGRVTGAMFEGDGEVMLRPPDRVERWSLSQFTNSAILSDQFTLAYLRFNDDTFAQLQEYLRPLQAAAPVDPDTEEDAGESVRPAAKPAATPEEFLTRWDPLSRRLAQLGVLRMLLTFEDAGSATGWHPRADDHFLMASLASPRLGVFQVYYDSLAAEQINVAQTRVVNNNAGYYNIWTSFPARSSREQISSTSATVQTLAAAERSVDSVHIERYSIRTRILPSRILQAETTLDLQTSEAGHRMLVFELSHFLNVKEVTLNGRPLEFVQNEAIEGSELSRRGNDNIGVVFPSALTPGQTIRLRFVYEGEVLSDAGGGLMYVGARGIWYPNRGFSMSDFDMEFRYPAQWTLVATGKRLPGEQKSEGEHVARYVSERPMPVAGFNVGQYVRAEAKAGPALVQTYASRGMERAFQQESMKIVPLPSSGLLQNPSATLEPQASPVPAAHAQAVADYTAHAVNFLAERLGPFPYSTLSVTQIPGSGSQSWPGLLYLSGYSFLSGEELKRAHVPEAAETLYRRLMPAHEAAHQWWGDLLIWNSYREQWLVEALSNYSVLLMLEKEEPNAFRYTMEQYRQQLMQSREGHMLSDSGPVTLGGRLISSRFPQAYDTIAYGRGTWLLHMLRHMLLDADAEGAQRRGKGTAETAANDRFFTILRKVRERYEGREITTHDLQQVFEENLPASLRYEGRKSLDWFFDNWVNGTAIPHLELSQIKLADGKKEMLATGHILQKEVPEGFVTSVPLYAVTGRSTVLIGRVYAEGPDSSFRLTAPAGTRRILLDPYQTILRR
jgi:hypothetical protein